jgi:hypothetical protein
MCISKPRPANGFRGDEAWPSAHEEALRLLQRPYLLGPVARNLHVYPRSRYRPTEFGDKAYCRVEGPATVVLNDALRLTASEWLGILSLTTLVIALGGPKRLPLEEIAARLRADPAHPALDGDWTLTRSLTVPLIATASRAHRWLG